MIQLVNDKCIAHSELFYFFFENLYFFFHCILPCATIARRVCIGTVIIVAAGLMLCKIFAGFWMPFNTVPISADSLLAYGLMSKMLRLRHWHFERKFLMTTTLLGWQKGWFCKGVDSGGVSKRKICWPYTVLFFFTIKPCINFISSFCT